MISINIFWPESYKMSLNRTLQEITERIVKVSELSWTDHLKRMRTAASDGPRRVHLTCENLAHTYAALIIDKKALAHARTPNIRIISAYNDMLSAH